MSRKFRPNLSQLIAVAVASLCLSALYFDVRAYGQQGETAEQVRERMEVYRQREAERERLKQERIERDRRKAEEEEKRREEEEAKKWVPYVDMVVYWKGWKQVKDGSWVTEYKDVKDLSVANMLPELPDIPGLPDIGSPGSRTTPPRIHQPLRPDPNQLNQATTNLPLYVDLDPQVQSGVLTPAERARGLGLLLPLDTGAHLQACRTGALSSRECSSGVVFSRSGRPRPGEKVHTEKKNYVGYHLGFIAVNCKSLTINKKKKWEDYSGWKRPDAGTSEEQLVIDLCSSHR